MLGIKSSTIWPSLFSGSVSAFESRCLDTTTRIYPEERAALGNVATKRMSDFSAGRACARVALSALGFDAFPLLRKSNGAPAWPDGIVGSITHTACYCAAVAAQRTEFISLGIDAEPVGRIHDRMLRTICNGRELKHLFELSADQRSEVISIMFSAKEACIKCLCGADIELAGFRDLTLAIRKGTFSAQSAAHPEISGLLKGHYRLKSGMVFAAAALEA